MLKTILEEKIFPEMVKKFDYKLVRMISDKMVNAPNDRGDVTC